jgi:uncharacterized protein YdaU (DUF1376 family)
MAKDPAFLFYPNDWIGGTMGMTFEEKGAYVELLMTQFNRGHMTTHMIGQVVGQIWDKIQDKFIKDDKGLWYNPRLEEEKLKRQNYTKSRRNNVSGENQHTKKDKKYKEKQVGHMDGHMTYHMEDENYSTNNKINNETNNIISNGTCEDEKKYFLSNEQWQMKIFTEMRLKKEELILKLNEFIKMIELKDDYKSAKELKSHFVNWYNKQKSIEPTEKKTTKIIF